MFKTTDSHEEVRTHGAETVIGPAVHVEGDLKAVGNVQIEGSLNGTITTDKDLIVGSKATVSADVKAHNAIIAGTIKGKISLSGNLNLKQSALIEGDVTTGSLSIENGAKLNGQIHMGGAKEGATQTTQRPSGHEKKEASE